MSSMRTLLHPTSEDLSLPHILYALGDPLRLRIVGQLAALDESISCGDIQVVHEVPKSTGSHHFKVLREAGVLSQRVVGTMRLNSLRRDDLDRCFPGLIDAVISSAPAPSSARL